ncbi:MAG: sensor domain-containing diguanylate cyclase [Nitrospirae bacterium]|nr:MAG: sensor domain-containing diguanylate cyclase [Nitrospirota bacterium]
MIKKHSRLSYLSIKLLNMLTFKDLPIRQKFMSFSVGTAFWLVVIAAIGMITMYQVNKVSKRMVDVIEPQQKVGHILIRKIRGASISAHKILLSKDMDKVNNNRLKAMSRIEDCRSYLNVLLNGGQIKDYSRGTGQFYAEFRVVAVTDPVKIELIKDISTKVVELEKLIEKIAESRFRAKAGEASLAELEEYDALTRDSVTIINEYTNSLDKEWQSFKEMLQTMFRFFTLLTVFVFVLSLGLSIFFGARISAALSHPIQNLINQIRSLASGELDLTRKLAVNTTDELGELSQEFNKLMDTISHVTSFKKVIEEDETMGDIYLRLGRVFVEYLKIENFVIYEVTNSKNAMRVVYPPEAEGLELNCKREIQLDCELCRAKRTGHIVSSIDYPQVCKYFNDNRINSHVCVPIIIGGAVGGVVQIVCDKPERCEVVDLKNKISRAEQYITEVQPVLEAKRLMRTLKDSAVKDVLTGFYNRRFLEESFENLVAGLLRRGTTLGLLMCDLDFFKQTNDVYGHDVGDMVLKETANNIRKGVRSSDIVIRFGGEEFLVLLVDIKSGDSFGVGDKIREIIQDAKIKMAGGYIQKTISIGVSEFPNDTQNFWEAIKYADVALYKAKEAGRNKVMRFDISMWTEEKY